MKNYTKQESVLIVNHAERCNKNAGRKQYQLCDDIEVDRAFFGRAKTGEKTLSDQYLNKLVEMFGYPRRGAGLFVRSESYNGINEFFNSYDNVQEIRFSNRQIKLWKDSDFIKAVTRLFKVIENNSEYSNKKAYILMQLNSMVEDEAFSDWYDLYEPIKESSTLESVLKGEPEKKIEIEPSLEKILAHYNLKSSITLIEPVLQRLGMMKYQLKGIDTFTINQSELNTVNEKELVISGDLVLEERFTSPFKQSRRSKILEDQLRECSLESIIPEGDSLLHRNELVNKLTNQFDYIDDWSSVVFKVFLGEEMGYHFLLTFEGKSSRVVTISLANNHQIISDVKQIYSFLGQKNPDLFGLKSALAKAGAYIPGATVLT